MIPILMHQMRILTSYVSSIMLRSKNLKKKTPKCYDCKDPPKTQTQYFEMVPNPSKNRAMHEGYNPSF
jgi:hypothetical protein